MLTKLDAVNEILDVIGEASVNSIESGLADAADALETLERVSKRVQSKGWHCNTEYEFPMLPDENGHIVLPATTLRADADGRYRHINTVVRREDGELRLYNVKERSFTFDHKLTVTLTYLFDYEELTPELQMYIAAKAAREYQENEMGSVSLDSFARRKELETWAGLMDAESESEDHNALLDSPSLRQITLRNNRLYGH